MKAEDFRQWREARSMTQRQLAELLDMTARQLQHYEAGDRRIPRVVELALEALSGQIAHRNDAAE